MAKKKGKQTQDETAGQAPPTAERQNASGDPPARKPCMKRTCVGSDDLEYFVTFDPNRLVSSNRAGPPRSRRRPGSLDDGPSRTDPE